MSEMLGKVLAQAMVENANLLNERALLASALLLTVDSLDPYVQTGKETCTIDELIAPIGIEVAYALAKRITNA